MRTLRWRMPYPVSRSSGDPQAPRKPPGDSSRKKSSVLRNADGCAALRETCAPPDRPRGRRGGRRGSPQVGRAENELDKRALALALVRSSPQLHSSPPPQRLILQPGKRYERAEDARVRLFRRAWSDRRSLWLPHRVSLPRSSVPRGREGVLDTNQGATARLDFFLARTSRGPS